MAVRRGKVGVLTFHKCINYGSYWQARCLVEALRHRGHDAELLDHDCRCVRRAEAKCALQPKLPARTPAGELPQYRAKARKFIDAIAALPQSPRFSLHEPEAAGDYDVVVVGSDEVWNFRHPWYGSKPIFFGDGVRARRLVSYGASFGNHSAWDGFHPEWAGKLDRFAALSVRDENSWHLVRGGTGREAEIVVDPCLLYPSAAKLEPVSGEPYALVYGHGFPAWLKALIRRWSDRNGVRLVSVGYSNPFAHEQRIGEGPIEFARLMAGARAVITNFFHGCVFALLHGKPWAAVPSDYRSIKIPDLAALLRTEHRLLGEQASDDELAELLETPMRPVVETRLSELRAHSDAWLDEALA
ncbi:MAG: polysaccharide pyruvyl transferase family protein [Sphingomonas sp.]